MRYLFSGFSLHRTSTEMKMKRKKKNKTSIRLIIRKEVKQKTGGNKTTKTKQQQKIHTAQNSNNKKKYMSSKLSQMYGQRYAMQSHYLILLHDFIVNEHTCAHEQNVLTNIATKNPRKNFWLHISQSRFQL